MKVQEPSPHPIASLDWLFGEGSEAPVSAGEQPARGRAGSIPQERLAADESRRASFLRYVLRRAVRDIPSCVAVAWQNIDTGETLGVCTSAPEPDGVLDKLEVAVWELFQGDGLARLTKVWSGAAGVAVGPEDQDLREVLVSSRGLHHLVLRSSSRPSLALVAVTHAKANTGLVLIRSRGVLRELEAVT